MNNPWWIKTLVLAFCAGWLLQTGLAANNSLLEESFRNPPAEARITVYWFWANTVTREGIRRDLEEMRRTGIGRAILSMTRKHSATVEAGGVVFLSPQWLALFRYALDEAKRLGIKISAVMSNG